MIDFFEGTSLNYVTGLEEGGGRTKCYGLLL